MNEKIPSEVVSAENIPPSPEAVETKVESSESLVDDLAAPTQEEIDRGENKAHETAERLDSVRTELAALDSKEHVPNPNSIGEFIFIGNDIETSTDLVYRSVKSEAAINDLKEHGFVRNAQSAGAVPKSRWGERVFWSRGRTGKTVGVSDFMIVAPYDVASQRSVSKKDVVSVFRKQEDGTVVDVVDQIKDVSEKNSAIE